MRWLESINRDCLGRVTNHHFKRFIARFQHFEGTLIGALQSWM
jgi:hypothetical protein